MEICPDPGYKHYVLHKVQRFCQIRGEGSVTARSP
ncbi:hypothetical protein LINGRAHAP2_LOCUS23755 [Linum grandiflorum]